MADCKGKTVLVTGASGGLGGTVVDAFLEANAEVFGVSRSGLSKSGMLSLTVSK